MNWVPLSVTIEFGTPEPEDHVSKEQNSLLGSNLADGSSLDPLGEFIVCHQQVPGPFAAGLLQRANKVKSPHGERPRDGDGLQSVGWEVCLPSVELATLAGPYDVGGIGDHGGPVKALPKHITHEGARVAW